MFSLEEQIVLPNEKEIEALCKIQNGAFFATFKEWLEKCLDDCNKRIYQHLPIEALRVECGRAGVIKAILDAFDEARNAPTESSVPDNATPPQRQVPPTVY